MAAEKAQKAKVETTMASTFPTPSIFSDKPSSSTMADKAQEVKDMVKAMTTKSLSSSHPLFFFLTSQPNHHLLSSSHPNPATIKVKEKLKPSCSPPSLLPLPFPTNPPLHQQRRKHRRLLFSWRGYGGGESRALLFPSSGESTGGQGYASGNGNDLGDGEGYVNRESMRGQRYGS